MVTAATRIEGPAQEGKEAKTKVLSHLVPTQKKLKRDSI